MEFPKQCLMPYTQGSARFGRHLLRESCIYRPVRSCHLIYCNAKMTLTTLQPLAYAVAYVSFFFGVASTVLRFYCRQYVLRIWGWDDYVAVAILVCDTLTNMHSGRTC
jgi:hypothetical protein